jgi:hypothetical protein
MEPASFALPLGVAAALLGTLTIILNFNWMRTAEHF